MLFSVDPSLLTDEGGGGGGKGNGDEGIKEGRKARRGEELGGGSNVDVL